MTTTAPSRPLLTRVSGSLAEARPMPGAALYELARVGNHGLLGEVIRVQGETATLQVYEDTTGLATGEPVEPTGAALAVELGPGLLGAILDGVGRPLGRIAEQTGNFIQPGASAETLEATTRWTFRPVAKPGETVEPGDLLGTVPERTSVEHRVMVPPGVSGTLESITAGEFTIRDPVARLKDGTVLRLAQSWPVRRPRPVSRRLPDDRPLVTGQRVLDFLFPAAEGGTVAVPGGFGTGKTVIEQSLAKYAEADIVVYIGCGERGNEMAEVLHEFPGLKDPRTGGSIMDRTVMVVNTSNMPVAAREASVYLGITIAEYYRDMGYRVALLADSLSRWAEALREISGRLAEMPGEESYPTYLAGRLGQFFERAGRVTAMGRPERIGALTVVAAISPPGGDFSEPVTQATLRVAGTLWALDAALAHQRQFPAVDWGTSYSLQADAVSNWFAKEGGADWPDLRRSTLELLERGRELKDIAGLVGPEALQDADRLLLESARLIQELVLGQSAYDPNDAFSPVRKTYRLVSLALGLHRRALAALERGTRFEHLELGPARRVLAGVRNAAPDEFEAREAEARQAIEGLGGAAR
ncbi:MAG TPA: V-type ATP synthase subunit A [Gemmatimonadales bacterium]|jgi:V/A-type H+-transporting ATPase subunit A|nr:V-type ATP synthase subunit A [Gemmatimonadales bacterium]